MRFLAAVLSACLLNYAFGLPVPGAKVSILEPKEIKADGSADWSRVVGGADASSGQFPYMVSLRREGSHFCGAAIISSTYIVTAAHCTLGLSWKSITAVVGTTTLNSGGTAYDHSNLINHPDYDWRTVENDISLLRTTSSIVGSSVVASIPIGNTYIGAGVTVTLTGWGQTSTSSGVPNNLQYINLSTITTAECEERHAPYDPVFESNLCTYTQRGEGSCYGDSGGPLATSGVLVGLVSWGEPCAVGYPDVFTRVSSFVPWILENAT